MKRQMDPKGTGRNRTSTSKYKMSKDAKETILFALYIHFWSANDGSNFAPLHYVEHVLIEIIQNSVLDKVSEHNIER